MTQHDVLVSVYPTHIEADKAVGILIENGFDMKNFSVIGKGYHTDEKIIGFYNTGERMKFWGKYGVFWGGLWGLLFGGIFLTVPVIGPVVVVGQLAAAVIAAIEGAVVVGGLSTLGAALFSAGIPKDSVVQYEKAIVADSFIVMAHGPADEVARARSILVASNPADLDWHRGVVA
jgi:hypothetical protein